MRMCTWKWQHMKHFWQVRERNEQMKKQIGRLGMRIGVVEARDRQTEKRKKFRHFDNKNLCRRSSEWQKILQKK